MVTIEHARRKINGMVFVEVPWNETTAERGMNYLEAEAYADGVSLTTTDNKDYGKEDQK